MSDIFDRIASSAPLNSTAAKVTSRGTHYEPKFNPSRETWDVPPPMKPVPNNAVQAKGIIGIKFGRLTVVGLAAATSGSKQGASWVVRCVCGAYEVRKARAIRNPVNTDDCCQRCEAVRRNEQRYRLFGPRAIEEFTKPEPAE